MFGTKIIFYVLYMSQYAKPARSSSFGRSFSSSRSSSFGGGSRSSFGGGRSSSGGSSRFGGGRRGGSRSKAQHINRSMYINDLQKEQVEEKSSYVGKKYTDFNLVEAIAKNLKDKGYEFTTEIQEKAIPLIMEGKDLLGISATGSGKTGAFLIPLIQKLLTDKSQKLLIVAPTRELAQQISKEAISILRGTFIHLCLVIGGESMFRQIDQLRRGTHIVVCTPGRLTDLMERGNLNLSEYNNIVVDEVDRMFDMGFINDIKFIFTKLAPKRQSLFFSATHNSTVEKIVDSLSTSYDIIKLSNNTPSKSVVQSVIDYTHSSEKIELLEEILKREDVKKAIIFVDTKRFADEVDRILYERKFKVGVIHGDKRQSSRRQIIEMFKRSQINVLVATNVAARGIDITDITHVINLDEPQTYDEYIHRIGRTGRNGALGTAYTFVKKSSYN